MILGLRRIVLWFMLSAAVTSGACVGLFFGGRILGLIVPRQPMATENYCELEDLP